MILLILIDFYLKKIKKKKSQLVGNVGAEKWCTPKIIKKKQLLLWTVLYIFLYNKISNHINKPQLKDASDPLFQYVKRISVLYSNF